MRFWKRKTRLEGFKGELMAPRGPYAKGVAKRAEILDAALEIIDRDGYSKATVKQLADAVDLSQNGLLHYFGSKDALFTEVIRHRGALDMERGMGEHATHVPISFAGAIEGMARGIGDIAGFLQLYLRLVAEATEADHESHEYFRERFATQRRLVLESIVREQEEGRIRRDADPAMIAAMLFGLVDGLNVQSMYEGALDVPAHVRHFFTLIGPPAADI